MKIAKLIPDIAALIRATCAAPDLNASLATKEFRGRRDSSLSPFHFPRKSFVEAPAPALRAGADEERPRNKG